MSGAAEEKLARRADRILAESGAVIHDDHFVRMVAGIRVLVVDDVVNTGESVAETASAVRDAGGEVVTVAALCTRGNAAADNVGCDHFVWLTEVEIPSWPAAECELSRRGCRSTPNTPTGPTSSPRPRLRGNVATHSQRCPTHRSTASYRQLGCPRDRITRSPSSS